MASWDWILQVVVVRWRPGWSVMTEASSVANPPLDVLLPGGRRGGVWVGRSRGGQVAGEGGGGRDGWPLVSKAQQAQRSDSPMRYSALAGLSLLAAGLTSHAVASPLGEPTRLGSESPVSVHLLDWR